MALSFILPLTRFSHHYSFTLNSNSKSIHIARTLISAISTPTNSMSSSSEVSKTAAPFGSWKSPITSDVVSGSSKQLGGTAVDSLGRLIWLESRPTESGSVRILKPKNDVSLFIGLFIVVIVMCLCYCVTQTIGSGERGGESWGRTGGYNAEGFWSSDFGSGIWRWRFPCFWWYCRFLQLQGPKALQAVFGF